MTADMRTPSLVLLGIALYCLVLGLIQHIRVPDQDHGLHKFPTACAFRETNILLTVIAITSDSTNQLPGIVHRTIGKAAAKLVELPRECVGHKY